MVSHWQVPSKATASLMSKMFEELGTELELGASSYEKARSALISKKAKYRIPFLLLLLWLVTNPDSWFRFPEEKLANTN